MGSGNWWELLHLAYTAWVAESLTNNDDGHGRREVEWLPERGRVSVGYFPRCWDLSAQIPSVGLGNPSSSTTRSPH